MKKHFGDLADGRSASLYTITGGGLTAKITDYGAALVSLFVPDKNGNLADVVLGFDDASGYAASDSSQGATVGRCAGRIQGASFHLNGKKYELDNNELGNTLHSGFDRYNQRLWNVVEHEENAITLELHSPNGDQGFPGNAVIRVTYRLDGQRGLHIVYDVVTDQDTVLNLTNHSYFNLSGHDQGEKAMSHRITIPGRFFLPADATGIPTGETREVAGSPMDFRKGKAMNADIGEDYDALNLQGGYDHSFEVFCQPCAIVEDAESGRSMAVYTDCPAIHLYTANYLENEIGKGGALYPRRSAYCLEAQFYPDAIHHSDWPQPVVKAGEKFHSETIYKFG